jgi:hypothetical protein
MFKLKNESGDSGGVTLLDLFLIANFFFWPSIIAVAIWATLADPNITIVNLVGEFFGPTTVTVDNSHESNLEDSPFIEISPELRVLSPEEVKVDAEVNPQINLLSHNSFAPTAVISVSNAPIVDSALNSITTLSAGTQIQETGEPTELPNTDHIVVPVRLEDGREGYTLPEYLVDLP